MPNRTALFSRRQPGGVFTIQDQREHPGSIFFVDSSHAAAANAAGGGQNPDTPLATIDYAIGLCTASKGDVIYVMPGHTESVATAIAADVAGISIIGLGESGARPQLTITDTNDGIDITADNVVIENLAFPTPSGVAASDINIGAANARVSRCHFAQGANSRDAITITAAGELPEIEGCTVIVSANGPDSWIKTEGVIDRPHIHHNLVIGSDGTNAYDDGVINYASQAVTNPSVHDNLFLGGGATTAVVANGGSLVGETMGPNVYGGSATGADNVTGQSEILDQISGSTGIPTWPAAAVPGNGVSLAEVLRDLWDAVRNGTGGSEPGTNKSLVDAIGFDGAAAVAASAGMLRTANGTRFAIKKTLTSSAILQTGVDVTAVSTVGEILIEDVVVKTDGTGLAAGTNFELETNNAKGLADFFVTAVSGLGASKTVDLNGASVTKIKTVLESGAKVVAKCSAADCTGAGTIDVYLLCRRLADNATLAAA